MWLFGCLSLRVGFVSFLWNLITVNWVCKMLWRRASWSTSLRNKWTTVVPLFFEFYSFSTRFQYKYDENRSIAVRDPFDFLWRRYISFQTSIAGRDTTLHNPHFYNHFWWDIGFILSPLFLLSFLDIPTDIWLWVSLHSSFTWSISQPSNCHHYTQSWSTSLNILFFHTNDWRFRLCTESHGCSCKHPTNSNQKNFNACE